MAGPIYSLSRSAIGVFAYLEGAESVGGVDIKSRRSRRVSILPGLGGTNGLGRLRPLSCEDCSIGLWMLAHNIVHGEDPRLCATSCEAGETVAVYHGDRCNGLCDPRKDLAQLHESDTCREEGPLLPLWSVINNRKLSKVELKLLRCRREEDGLISTAACRIGNISQVFHHVLPVSL